MESSSIVIGSSENLTKMKEKWTYLYQKDQASVMQFTIQCLSKHWGFDKIHCRRLGKRGPQEGPLNRQPCVRADPQVK